ncbi:MAG: FliH/SctL family protein [Bacteriovoracia bacterium]
MSFEPFQYQGAKKVSGSADPKAPVPAGVSGGPVKYQEPTFVSRVSPKEADSSHRHQNEHFHLDKAVAGQLGIDDRVKQEQEDYLEKELARRWEKMSDQAEAAGYTKGLEEGKAEAHKAEVPRLTERMAKFDQLLQELDGCRAQVFTANEAFLMDLVARVAGMVALKEVEVDPDYIRRVVMALLQQLGSKDDLKIFLSEADVANIDSLRGVIEKEYGKLTNTVIETSPEIPVGGCKIETRFGVVDASVATQIDNVMKALKTR